MLNIKSDGFLRSGTVSLIIKLLGAGLSLLLSVVLARALGADDFGYYSWIMAIVAVVAIPTQLGLPHLIIRETAIAIKNNDWPLAKGIMRWSNLMVFVFSVVLAVALILLSALFDDDADASWSKTLYAVIFIIPLLSLAELRGAAIRGMGGVNLGQIPEAIVRPAIIIAVILGLYVLRGSVGPVEAINVYLLAALISFILGWFLLRHMAPKDIFRSESLTIKSRDWISSAWPLALTAGVVVINGSLDLITLGFFWEDAVVGQYRVAVALCSVVIFGLQAINMVVSPQIAQLYKSGDLKSIEVLAKKASLFSFSIGVVVTGVIVFWGMDILTLIYGAEYSAAFYPLLILCGGQLFNAAMGSVGSLLNMTGNERVAMRSVVLALLINVVLNVAFVPEHGMLAAALSTSASLLVWNCYQYLAVKKRLNISSSFIG